VILARYDDLSADLSGQMRRLANYPASHVLFDWRQATVEHV
jgi:hypothetical protein